MGMGENLRKPSETPMKPMNYTWDLHLKRYDSGQNLCLLMVNGKKKDKKRAEKRPIRSHLCPFPETNE